MFFLPLAVFVGLYFLLTSGIRSKIHMLETRMDVLEKGLKNVPVQVQATVAVPTQPVGQIPPVQPVVTQTPTQPAVATESQAHSMETFANRMAKLGIVVLAIGILYFLSYINSKGWLGQTAKFSIGLIVGVACVGIAEWVKRKSAQYAQILRGGGFIIWYITLYVGTFVYGLVSLPVTLGLIVGILIISAMVSLNEKREISFFLGVLGAYIMPWIAGVALHNAATNLQLLVYILIINCGIIGLSIFQNWRKSLYTGFFFTWTLFLSIYSMSGSLQLGWSTLFIFATLFGLQFLIVFIMGDIRRGRQYTTEIGSTVKEGEVFLTATNTFLYVWTAYSLLSAHFKDYIGFLALLLGLFHFGIYLFIRKMQGNTTQSVSALTHFVIFVVLVTAAIPMQFDGPIVTMVWFIEGVVLAYLATTNEFKHRGIMYMLGLGGIVLGVLHMLAYGNYQGVSDTGTPVVNQFYLVWFFVAALIHFVAYLWKNIGIEKVRAFALFLFIAGQVFFVTLTSVEIWSYYGYQHRGLYSKEYAAQNEFEDYYGYSVYDRQVTPAQRVQFDQNSQDLQNQRRNLNNMAAFINALFFVIMTTVYLLIGLLKQNKLFRRLGVVMLVITLVQIVSLAWQFGPVYRFITFLVLGVILLILSYLYIHHSKKVAVVNEIK